MTSRVLFPTLLYRSDTSDADLLADLLHSCRSLEAEDKAGRAWARANNYPGYTSYASLNDLARRDPSIAALVKIIDRHVAAFAADCAFDLPRKLRLDSLWVNILKAGAGHSGHIHPHCAVSGTFYVSVPKGAGALKLEDPRLPAMMAAPPRRSDAPEASRTFVYVEPAAGTLLLWESWLRHEVVHGTAKQERISISFNYR